MCTENHNVVETLLSVPFGSLENLTDIPFIENNDTLYRNFSSTACSASSGEINDFTGRGLQPISSPLGCQKHKHGDVQGRDGCCPRRAKKRSRGDRSFIPALHTPSFFSGVRSNPFF